MPSRRRAVAAEVFPVSPGQHKRRARRGWGRRDDTKGRHKFCTDRFAGQKEADTVGASAAERIPEPWVLAAFFGYFLSLETESTPPEAYRVARGAVCGGTHGPCRGVRYNRRTGSSAPTDDMRVCASPGRRGEGAPPYGVQQEVQWFGSSRTPPPTSGLQAVQGRDDAHIVPYGRG